MTTTEAPVVLRVPGWARALAALALPVSAGISSVPDVDPTLPLVALVVGALALSFLAWSVRVSVMATADGRLVVRDLLITLTVPRDHVRSVEIDEARPSGHGLAVFVRTHEDIRFRLDATLWPFPARLEGQAEALRSWRDGRPQAFLDPART